MQLLGNHTHPSVIAESYITWWGIFLQSVQVSCPGCVPSHPFAQPQTTVAVIEWKIDEALTLCKHCSVTGKALCWQHCCRS